LFKILKNCVNYYVYILDKEMETEEIKHLQHLIGELPIKKETIILQDEQFQCTFSFLDKEGKSTCERYVKLKSLMGFESPVVVVSKNKNFWKDIEKPFLDENSFNFVKMKKKGSSSSRPTPNPDQSSICGSPLKLDVIADLSVFAEGDEGEKESVSRFIDCGLSLQLTRRLVSLYSVLCCSKNEVDTERRGLPTLMAVCDGQNISQVAVMAICPLTDKQNNFLGTKITKVVCTPLALKTTHVKLHPSLSNPNIVCRAKYDIHRHTVEKASLTDDSFIQLDLEWGQPPSQAFQLLHDPPLQAKTNATIHNTPGHSESPLFTLYQVFSLHKQIKNQDKTVFAIFVF